MSEKTFTTEDILYLLDEVEPNANHRGREMLIEQLRVGPYAELYRKIEAMADDAGTDRRLIGWEREAVLNHQLVDRLLAAPRWEHPAEIIELDHALELDYQALLNVCAARRRRGEGDAEQLRNLEHKLERTRDAASAQQREVAAAQAELRHGLDRLAAACEHEPEGVETLARVSHGLLDHLLQKIDAARTRLPHTHPAG